MTLLKTNYTDSVAPDGARTYRISPQNAPQDAFACEIVDETQYLRNGDRFGAADINATNKAVNDHIPTIASGTVIGHAGLSDAIDAGNADVNSGYAATPRAVALVNAKADTAQGTADAALPKMGGTMTDWIHWNRQTKGLQWVTDDGTIFQLRPYSAGNSYQLVTQKPNGTVLGTLDINKDGWCTMNGRSSQSELSFTLKDANNDTGYRLYKDSGSMHVWNATENHEDYIGTAKKADGAARGDFPFSIGAKLENWNKQAFFLWASGEQAYRIMLGVRDDIWTLCPDVNNNVYLGTASARWGKLFCVNAPDVSSDRRLKTDIAALEDAYTNLILRLPACRYRLLADAQGKTHMGFVAQDVEALMQSLGLDPAGHNVLGKHQKYNEVQEIVDYWDEALEDVAQRVEMRYLPIAGEYEYSLCYEELIAPLAALCQRQQRQLDAQAQQLVAIEQRLLKLEGTFDTNH